MVDDEPATRWALERALQGWQCVVLSAREVGSGARCEPIACDVILVGRIDPEESTTKLVRALHSRIPDVPVILLDPNGRGSAAALRAGVFDCLPKPLDPDALLLAVQRAVDWSRLQHENVRLERAVQLLRHHEETTRKLQPAPSCKQLSCVLGERLSLRELEDRYISVVLEVTGGNKVRAAEILGIHRRTLYRRSERGRREPGQR